MKKKVLLIGAVVLLLLLPITANASRTDRDSKPDFITAEEVLMVDGEALEFVKKSEAEIQTEENGFYYMEPPGLVPKTEEEERQAAEAIREKEEFAEKMENGSKFVKGQVRGTAPAPTEEEQRILDQAREESIKRGEETLVQMNLAMKVIYEHTGKVYVYEAFVPADLDCIEDAIYVHENFSLSSEENEAIEYYLSHTNTIFTVAENDKELAEEVFEIVEALEIEE